MARCVSPPAQNELIELMYRIVLNKPLDKIRLSKLSVMCNDTCDCSGKEQENICLRLVDSGHFVGLYDSSDSTFG